MKYLTVNEASDYLRIPPANVRYHCRAGNLKSEKRGRDWDITASKSELDKFAVEHLQKV